MKESALRTTRGINDGSWSKLLEEIHVVDSKSELYSDLRGDYEDPTHVVVKTGQ